KQALPLLSADFDRVKATLEAEQQKQPERDRLDREIAALEAELPSYAHADGLTREVAALKQQISKDTAAHAEGQNEVAHKEIEIKASKDKLRTLENASVQKEKLEAELTVLTAQSESLAALCTDLNGLDTLRDQRHAAQDEYRALSLTAQQMTDRYQALNQAFLDEQAGVIAARLEDGVPCPVCGSLHHPSPAKASESAPTEDELKRAKRDADNAAKKAESQSLTCGTLTGQLTSKTEDVLAKIAVLLGDIPLEAAAPHAKQAAASLDDRLKVLTSSIAAAEASIREKTTIEQGLPIMEQLIEQLHRSSNKLSQAIAANTATLTLKEEQLTKLCTELRYASQDQARAAHKALLAQKDAHKRVLDEVTARYQATQAALAKLEGELATLKAVVANVCEIDFEVEKQKKAELEATATAVQNEREHLAARLQANERCLVSMAQTHTDAQAIETHYRRLSTLSDTANGHLSGRERITLETYIQMTYFDRILYRANRRLQRMTEGQYDLVRRRDSGDFRSSTGLDLDVIDHSNGSVRPVNTLSGGEAFKASLALALGLSDEIQSNAGGVRLDTMFIDEGFGSLDDESLRLAIATLQDLTDGNRLVGIISHVSELKSKIEKQIVVTKDGCGGSRCQIVV
ncbi:MAG: SMC family ATPase, partial [Clostridia bacterium]|nr:SMC family ATPase [Clostridia bacterium]